MLRLKTDEGWWLITHPEHARLASEFAAHWGNAQFPPPQPRAYVLHGIRAHDNGWAARDAQPLLSNRGEPAAFSTDLVGKYSAFEEIDLPAYLAVRRNALQQIAQQDPYAAILISMHTFNLLSERADRSTIQPEQVPLLDDFLAEQRALQASLRECLLTGNGECEDAAGPKAGRPRAAEDAAARIAGQDLSLAALQRNFQLLQACDNLSLVSCVDFRGDATLLHPFLLRDGSVVEVRVARAGERCFRLTPYPLDTATLTFELQARFVPGLRFASPQELQERFAAAELKQLQVKILS